MRSVKTNRMLLCSVVIVLTLAVVGVTAQTPIEAEFEMPLSAGNRGGGFPHWVSARSVTVTDGVPASAYFPTEMLDDLLIVLGTSTSTKTEDCVVTEYQSSAFSKTLEERASEVPWIGFGTVTGLDGGFLQERPGTLIRVEISSEIGESQGPLVRYYYHPNAEFGFLGYRVCFKEKAYAPLPQVGDEVVLLLDKRDAARELLLGNDAETLVVLPAGSSEIHLSSRVAADAIVEAEDREALRELLYNLGAKQ